MKKFRLRRLLKLVPVLMIVPALTLCFNADAIAKKRSLKLGYDKKSATRQAERDGEAEMAKGSFMVASQCEDCNNGYRLEQIDFNGYDKPQQSGVETFFITNNTDRTISGIRLYIDYRTLDGRQLHRRFVSLSCNIPPGETRQAEVKSWDKQSSFYYEKSKSARKAGMPYVVIFDPVAYYLRY